MPVGLEKNDMYNIFLRFVTSYTQEGFGDGGDDVRYDTEVDYGGHTWCFRPQWTRHLWNTNDLFWETGEDIQLSAHLWYFPLFTSL